MICWTRLASPTAADPRRCPSRGRDVGFDAHLVKPVALAGLRAVLDRVRSGT
jgi:hypothetical protein